MKKNPMWPFKPPFSYQKLKYADGETIIRVRDFDDNLVATALVEENAALVAEALNRMAGLASAIEECKK